MVYARFRRILSVYFDLSETPEVRIRLTYDTKIYTVNSNYNSLVVFLVSYCHQLVTDFQDLLGGHILDVDLELHGARRYETVNLGELLTGRGMR